ncbi:signal peptidase I [Prosthecobacter sp.]|uniref:signal peptidase I n=1 Tax=Prosthecobacter sp. TaxID=1965333 RepID=UPI0037846611
MKRWFNTILIGTSVLTGVLFVIWVVLATTGMVKIYSVPTNGMATFVSKGDQLIAERFSILSGLPRRGDVVTFTTAGIESPYLSLPAPAIFIKRVIGLPGDRLQFKGDVLQVNGRPVGEYFDLKGIVHLPQVSLASGGSVTVPPDHLFVMGDNSGNSLDSRYWGPLPVKNLRQKYWFHVKHGPAVTEAEMHP